MNAEMLAKQMRERALMIEENPVLDKAKDEVRERNLKRLESIQKLYFNAGRWAGGARDWTAREAYEKLMTQDGLKLKQGRSA